MYVKCIVCIVVVATANIGRDGKGARSSVGRVNGCGQCIGLLWECIPLGGRATSMQVHGRHSVATHTHIYTHIHLHTNTYTRHIGSLLPPPP